MSISIGDNTFVVGNSSQPINISSIVNVSIGVNPQYLIVDAVDRIEYTAGSNNLVGSFSANGHSLQLGTLSASAQLDGAGIVYTYNASTGRYTNAVYGDLSQLQYNASSNTNDMTQIAIYATNSPADASYGGNFVAMQSLFGTSDYVGSATVATQPSFTGAIPSNATPNSVAAAAMGFVGKIWNNNGCWILASTIADEAGASLPSSTCFSGTPVANGEWFVAYNGAASPNTNWQSLVKAGEIVSIPGHITTVVSGSGATAMLVDNATNGSNSAHDGDSSDMVISQPFLASLEFKGLQSSGIAIYELDCPLVTAAATSGKIITTAAMTSLFSAADPNNKSITLYQIYDSAGNSFTVNGSVQSATSAATPITVSSLSGVTFTDPTGIGDSIQVRAENALGYWGDWTSQSVDGGTTVTSSAFKAPVGKTIVSKVWKQGQTINVALPTGTFTDPQGEALTYFAQLTNGSSLPSWLTVNSKTGTLTGVVGAGATSLSIGETATDTSNLSTTENFTVTIIEDPVAQAIAAQSWSQGQKVNFALPSGSFTDPQGETMTYTAKLASGAHLPSWLTVNSKTGALSGTVAGGATSLSIIETATNSSGLSATDSISVSITEAPIAKALASQSWKVGQSVDFTPTVFSDPQGQTLTYSAKLASGAALPSWLSINSQTGEMTGTAPSPLSNMVILLTATDTSGLSASEALTVSAVSAPVVAKHEADVTALQGTNLSLSLAAEFSDPQHQKLTYSVSGLASWMEFNATTDKLTGTPPSSAGSTTIIVTATDTAGLSATDSFTVNNYAAPVVSQTPSQTMLLASSSSFTLPTGTFTDPQNQHLTLTAGLSTGQSLPSWLTFDADTATFSGTSPAKATPLTVEVTAKDTSGLVAHDIFTIVLVGVSH